MKQRLFMILIFALLALATVMIIGSALGSEQMRIITSKQIDQSITLSNESEVFRSTDAATPATNGIGNRRMSDYYNNRAYPGAPPAITHPLLSEVGMGGKACLQCHENGGYVEQFGAYAPVTPHPTWINCRQCHVPMDKGKSFTATNWVKPSPPPLGRRAISTGPLVMPHPIQGRENCLSCHAGPASPLEIRVTHPERRNCRQCHLPSVSGKEFDRSMEVSAGEAFRRAEILHNTSLNSPEKVGELKSWIEQH